MKFKINNILNSIYLFILNLQFFLLKFILNLFNIIYFIFFFLEASLFLERGLVKRT